MTQANTKQVYVDAQGRLTPEGYRLLADMAAEIARLKARLAAAGIP